MFILAAALEICEWSLDPPATPCVAFAPTRRRDAFPKPGDTEQRFPLGESGEREGSSRGPAGRQQRGSVPTHRRVERFHGRLVRERGCGVVYPRGRAGGGVRSDEAAGPR